jgi:hypothetical protein
LWLCVPALVLCIYAGFVLSFVLFGQHHNAEPFVEIIKILKIRTIEGWG